MIRSSNILIYIFVVMLVSAVGAQEPDTLWTETYGGADDQTGNSVIQAQDNGFIVAGTSTPSVGFDDGILIKTDPNGDTVWTATLGNTVTLGAEAVRQTSDGSIFVAGDINRGSFTNIFLHRLDSNGDSLWLKEYGSASDNDFASSMSKTSDGGFIITGQAFRSGTHFNVFLIRTDSEGDTLWTRRYGGSESDQGRSVQQTADGGYVVTGSFSAGDFDVYLIKTDANGDTLWTRRYGGSSSDIGASVQQTSDQGYIIAGWTDSFGAGGFDFYLIKTDSNGDTLWTKTFGGTNSDFARSVKQTTDGGYIITGFTESFGAGNADVYAIRTDANGDTLWTKTFGGVNDDRSMSVQQTNDDGFIIAGETESFGADEDIYLIRLDSEPTAIEVRDQAPNRYVLYQNFPNPFNPTTTLQFSIPERSEVHLEIFNALGQKVTTLVAEELSAGTYSYEWDAGNLPSGIYLYRLTAENFSQTRKLLLLE